MRMVHSVEQGLIGLISAFSSVQSLDGGVGPFQFDAGGLRDEVFIDCHIELAFLLGRTACHRRGFSSHEFAHRSQPLHTLGDLVLGTTTENGADIAKFCDGWIVFEECLYLFIDGPSLTLEQCL